MSNKSVVQKVIDMKDAEIDTLNKRLAAAGNELDVLRKVVWHLQDAITLDGWILYSKDAKANGLNIAALQKDMGK